MTNKEKFKEVFGFIPTNNQMYKVCPEGYDCDVIPCKECPFNDTWWDKKYKEAKND